MRKNASRRRRKKDCSFKTSDSASAHASSSVEERAASVVRRLVGEMEASFAAAQERARAAGESAPATSDEEIEVLVGDAIRRSRRGARNSSGRKGSRR